MDIDKLQTSVAMAQDTYDLLDHIAWTDVIKPRLIAEREKYTKLLVRSVLGEPLRLEGGREVSREQLAGKVHGIEFMIGLMERIMREGENAFNTLNAAGIGGEIPSI